MLPTKRLHLIVVFAFLFSLLDGVAWGSPNAAQASILAALPPAESNEALPAGVTIETVASGLAQPVAMAFDPAGRLFFTERGGGVRVIISDTLQVAPVITFDVNTCAERGLLGIAIDPDFSSNHYIYVYFTQGPGTTCVETTNKVVRFVENNGVGSSATEIFSSPAKGPGNHNGGNIHFGPDGKLYISVGDDGNRPQSSQDTSSRNGKIHRINPDGSFPSDNPVLTGTNPLGSVYALGVRNTFDFTFDPTDGTMWASENGPSCDDELNRILPGGNYGWRPSYPCDDNADGGPSPTYNTIPPLWWIPNGLCCRAPTGIEVYSGASIPAWQNELFMCNYAGQHGIGGILRHFHLSSDRKTVTSVGLVQGVTCRMDLQTGPDGALYFMEAGGYTTGSISRIVGNPATVTNTATASPTTTSTATATSLPNTATPTNSTTASRTSTPTATRTSTVTATHTSMPVNTATRTSTATLTPTLIPSSTATRTAIATSTQAPSNTSTAMPTRTATTTSVPGTLTSTATIVSATATRTATSSPNSATPTRTATGVPNSATSTPTSVTPNSATPTGTASSTATSTGTVTSLPNTATGIATSVSVTSTPTRTATATATGTTTSVPNTATPTYTATSTATTVASSATPTRTAIAISTATVTRTTTATVVTATGTATRTITVLPSTATRTTTATNTRTASATATATVTHTATLPVPATSTTTPSTTATPTNTAVSTNTATSTSTTTRISTSTALSTATHTSTPTATASRTASPQQTRTFTPTAVATATSTRTPIQFSDVATTDYFYTPVQYLAQLGAISGYADQTFRPYENGTRGQLAKIVVTAEGWPIDTSAGAIFTDVPATNPFYIYISTAFARGLISGYDDATFRPNNDVTRGQLTKIVVAAAGWAIVTPTTPTFVDVPSENVFYGAIETALAHGIISGYTGPQGKEFRWGADATRGQIAKIVYGAVMQQ